MKKHISIFLTVAMISILFTACNGSALALAPSSSTPEAKKTEITEGSVRKEKNAEAATDVEEARVEEVSVQDEKKSAAPTGFQLLSSTETDAEGNLVKKITYYKDNYVDSCATETSKYLEDEYGILFCDREYDDKGKWIGTKIYLALSITDIEGINPDDYKTNKNLISTEECKYDNNGFVIEERSDDGILLTKKTYNSQGQIIFGEHYNTGGETVYREYTYNEQGVLDEEVIKTGFDEAIIEYTPFGIMRLDTFYQSKAIKSGGINYTYTKELHYNDNGVLTGGEKIENGEVTETYTFLLDEYGNIIHYSVFDKDGKLQENVDFEIVPVYE